VRINYALSQGLPPPNILSYSRTGTDSLHCWISGSAVIGSVLYDVGEDVAETLTAHPHYTALLQAYQQLVSCAICGPVWPLRFTLQPVH
jgi:hypothetical protein